MTILFSATQQAFYDDSLDYPSLPNDVISIPEQVHWRLLDLINTGHYVFSDLTVSEPRPSSHHVMENGIWVDHRTAKEKREAYLRSLKPLTRRQFKLTLLNHDLLDKVSMAIDTIEDPVLKMRAKIEFEDSTTFERLNPTLAEIYKALGLKESKVDSLWEEGLKL